MIAASSLQSAAPGRYDYQNQDLPSRHPTPLDTNPTQLLSEIGVICENAHISKPIETSNVSDTYCGNESPACPFFEEVNTVESPTANLYKWFDDFNAHPEKGLPKYGDCNLPLPNSNIVQVTGSPYFLQPDSFYSCRESLDTARASDLVRGGNGSTDEYRSVIDDLTIENKKLRDELRRYKKQTNIQLEKDKLFEVRIHALPAAKRRELESALRSIASSLNYSSADPLDSVPYTLNQYSSSEETNTSTKKSMSISTYNSRIHNSQHASMIKSAPPNSSHHEGSANGKSQPTNPIPGPFKNHQKLTHENTSSYLPNCGLSKMTEMQKRMLTVQRLEQLFTGEKGIMMRDHNYALNQQEISRSAIGNDFDSPRPNGAREAHMRPKKEENTPQLSNSSNESEFKTLFDISDDTTSNSSSHDQRPTRPLDLDPDRAQVPSDNMEYIRHLGLSTPQLASDESSDPTKEKGGWIYLNLLINMAQLHIINVTADFVRSAVLDVSEKFEISKDGQMLRWKGGSKGTHLGSQGGSSSLLDMDNSNSYNNKVYNDSNFSNLKGNDNQPNPSTLTQRTSSNFQYKPLFYHQSPSDILSEGSDSILGPSQTNESNGTHNSRVRAHRNRKYFLSTDRKRYDDGSIIFYSGVNFCTDLSGDREAGLVLPSSSSSSVECETDSEGSLQNPPLISSLQRTKSGSFLPYRPFREPSIKPNSSEFEITEESDPVIKENSVGGFDLEPFTNDCSTSTISLPALKFSGVGGTSSADHFRKQVLTHRIPARSSISISKSHDIDQITQRILNFKWVNGTTQDLSMRQGKIIHGLRQYVEFPNEVSQDSASSNYKLIHTKIVSTEKFLLPPSKIPSPLGFPYTPESDFVSVNSVDSIDRPARHMMSYCQTSGTPSLTSMK